MDLLFLYMFIPCILAMITYLNLLAYIKALHENRLRKLHNAKLLGAVSMFFTMLSLLIFIISISSI